MSAFEALKVKMCKYEGQMIKIMVKTEKNMNACLVRFSFPTQIFKRVKE